MEKKELKDNIVYDSYYLISLFEQDTKDITQLQVQKLMYFVEAYYMNEKNVDFLYECPFKAWALGPVALPLYKEYSKYGESTILLNNEQLKIGDSIDSYKKDIIKEIYDFFGKKYTAIQLVNITHMDGSPWDEKWKENQGKVLYGSESDIDKIKTKNWFRKTFMRGSE